MRYTDEFRDPVLVKILSERIKRIAPRDRDIVLMEVCGTHTMSIFRFGLKKLLPDNIHLLSGPGCPVCVTPRSYIDTALGYSDMKDTVITTFGDMVKVPGSSTSLEKKRADGADVRIVYSPQDALDIASKEPDRKIIFLGIGFETTAPSVAATIKRASENKMQNFFVFCGHRLIPPALKMLAQDDQINIDGFILPGHVSTVIGASPYRFMSESFKKPCVITGFEPLDILRGIELLLLQIEDGSPRVEIQYTRAVKEAGNSRAIDMMNEVFFRVDSKWRGIGTIALSGYAIKKKYKRLDAEKVFNIDIPETAQITACRCGDILRGHNTPEECPLFGRSCTPEEPAGPCMVSSEGTCAAHFRYREG